MIEGFQALNYHLNEEVLVAFRENMSNGIGKMLEEISEKGRLLVKKGWDKTKQRSMAYDESVYDQMTKVQER